MKTRVVFSQSIVATIVSAQHDQSVAQYLLLKAKELKNLVARANAGSNGGMKELRQAIRDTRKSFKLTAAQAAEETSSEAEERSWESPWVRLDANQKRDLVLAVLEAPPTTVSKEEKQNRCALQCMVLKKTLNEIHGEALLSPQDFLSPQSVDMKRVNELIDQADMWHACLNWYFTAEQNHLVEDVQPQVDVKIWKGVAMGFMYVLRLLYTDTCPIGSLHILNLRYPMSHSSLSYCGEADKVMYAGRKRIDVCTGEAMASESSDGIWPLLRDMSVKIPSWNDVWPEGAVKKSFARPPACGCIDGICPQGFRQRTCEQFREGE